MNYLKFPLFIFLVCICKLVVSQTIIYSENFNSGAPAFQLNTTDQNSVSNGTNRWIINNSYAGGNISATCLGFPLSIPIVATPNQPVAITGSPQSNYLHITTSLGITSGTTNCHYLASDPLCNPTPENAFAKMTSDFSTAGFATINFSFYWMCSPPEAFGEIYYSTNSGGTWTLVPGLPSFSSTNTWAAASVSVPAFGNQPTLRLGFRFVSPTVSTGEDPAFAIDDLEISAPGVSNTITTGTVTAGPYCPGESVNIPYTVSGTFNAGNTFTAQLSNSGGNFASPVTIGTLSSTANGSISGTIPPGTPPGTGYRIRVVSSAPLATGSSNTLDIVVSGPPVASISNTSTSTVCANGTATLTYSGDPGAVQWLSSSTGSGFTPIANATGNSYTSGPLTSTIYYQVQVTTNCGTGLSASWPVTLTNTVNIPLSYLPNSLNLCNGPVTVSVQGAFQNLVWSNSQTAINSVVISSPEVISVSGEDLSGCPAQSTSLNFILTTPIPLEIIGDSVLVLCGPTVNLTATGGFTNYLWSNQATQNPTSINAAGIYSVTATDVNGCTSASDEVEVIGGTAVALPVTPASAAICNGQPVTLTAGNGFTNYLWSSGASGASISVTASGFYSCTALDSNGCEGTSPIVEVVKSQLPISNFSYVQNNGYTITFDNSTQNGISYTWNFESLGSSPIENPAFTFPDVGPYYVTLVATNPCGTDSVTKLVIVSRVGFAELFQAFGISVFPNPSNGDFYLNLDVPVSEDFNLDLLDVSGRSVFQETFHASGQLTRLIPAATLAPGYYLLRIQNKETSGILRLVKN